MKKKLLSLALALTFAVGVTATVPTPTYAGIFPIENINVQIPENTPERQLGMEYSNTWTRSNTISWNKVVLNEKGILSIDYTKTNLYGFENMYADMRVLVYDAEGNCLDYLQNTENEKNNSFYMGLNAGTYYVRIQPELSDAYKGKTTTYKFSLTPTEYCEVEKNETKATATPMVVDQKYTGYCGYYAGLNYDFIDKFDYYVVNLQKGNVYMYTYNGSVEKSFLFEKEGEFDNFGSRFYVRSGKTFTAPYTGEYYIGIKCRAEMNPQVKYELTVETVATACTVSFDSCGGTPVDSISVLSGNPIGELPTTTNGDKIFVGWSRVAGDASACVDSTMTVTENMTLYAIWQEPAPVPAPEPTPAPNEQNDSQTKLQIAEQKIKDTNTDKKDVKGSRFGILQLMAQGNNKEIQLTWNKFKGVKRYYVYGNACGKKMNKIATLSGGQNKFTVKKCKAAKFYKYIVVAEKNDGSVVISKTVHVKTKGGKYQNPSAVNVKKSSITIKKGKSVKIVASIKNKKKVKNHIAGLRYESGNTKIASVSSKGVIKAKAKGKCTIYVYAQNGVCKKITVTVK